MMLISSVFLEFSVIGVLLLVSFTKARPQHILRNSTAPKMPDSKKTKILNHPKNYSAITFMNRDDEYNDQDIVFPDSFEEEASGGGTIPRIDGVPKCAEGNTFCESFENYPYKHIKTVMHRTSVYKSMFGMDEQHDITNRIGEAEENFLCGAKTRTIFPKVGKTKSNKWKLIINHGDQEGYVQGINVETCSRPNEPCDLVKDIPIGYVTHCRQKFAYRRMVSLNDEGRPITDSFQMPTACCCSYKKDVQFLARFAGPVIVP